jgi:regulator of sigma E protease
MLSIWAVVVFILVLCVLIIVHEWGHFIAAKIFGIRVEEFAIGFPPRLTSIRRGDTEYSINMVLFGGFVRIYGERPDPSDTSHDPRNFSHRSRWIQAAVVVMGIVMNFVLAFVLFSAMYMIGTPTSATGATTGTLKNVQLTVVSVFPHSAADKAGLQSGDVITNVQASNGEKLQTPISKAAQEFIGSHSEQSMVIQVKRNGADKIFVANRK